MLPFIQRALIPSAPLSSTGSGPSTSPSQSSSYAAGGAIFDCLVGVLQIEAHGTPAVPKALLRVLSALGPALGLLPISPAQAGVSGGLSPLQGSSSASDLAAAFLAASNWLSRSPHQVARAALEASGVDWTAALKRLASTGAAAPAPANAAPTGVHPTPDGSSGPTPRLQTASNFLIPGVLLSGSVQRQAEATCSLAALALCPGLAQAWLQWGNQLYSWTRERRLLAGKAASGKSGDPAGAPKPPMTPAPSTPPLTLTDVEGFVASAEALCRFMALSSGGDTERHLPLLLRLLQVCLAIHVITAVNVHLPLTLVHTFRYLLPHLHFSSW